MINLIQSLEAIRQDPASLHKCILLKSNKSSILLSTGKKAVIRAQREQANSRYFLSPLQRNRVSNERDQGNFSVYSALDNLFFLLLITFLKISFHHQFQPTTLSTTTTTATATETVTAATTEHVIVTSTSYEPTRSSAISHKGKIIGMNYLIVII